MPSGSVSLPVLVSRPPARHVHPVEQRRRFLLQRKEASFLLSRPPVLLTVFHSCRSSAFVTSAEEHAFLLVSFFTSVPRFEDLLLSCERNSTHSKDMKQMEFKAGPRCPIHPTIVFVSSLSCDRMTRGSRVPRHSITRSCRESGDEF